MNETQLERQSSAFPRHSCGPSKANACPDRGAEPSGSYAYGGPVLSYKAKSFEPYIVGRLNYVHYGESGDTFEDIQWEAGTYTYVQFTLGSIFWLTKSIGLNIEGSAFAGKLGLADFEDFAASSFVVLGGVKFRF